MPVLPVSTATQVEICNLALRMIGANTITAIDDGSKEADYCSDFWTYLLEEVLGAHSWGFVKKVRKLDYTAGFGIWTDNDEKTVTNITQASPGVVSCASHGFSDGYTVMLDDVSGMTEVNTYVYEVEDVDGDSFKLVDTDTTNYTAYTSGGTAIRKEVDADYYNGYTYDIPSDLLMPLRLESRGNFEVFLTGNNARIVTGEQDASLIYLSNESTTTNLTNRFVFALARRLAAELSIPLSKKGAVGEKMWNLYFYTLGKTTVDESRNQSNPLDTDDQWLTDGNFSQ